MKKGNNTMAHPGKATTTAPPHGGGKPPPGHPPADGAKKNQHGPAGQGKDAHDKKGGQPPHPAPRRPINDDEPEEAAPAPSTSWLEKLPSRQTVLRAAIAIVTLLVVATAVYGSVRMVRNYQDKARHARIDAAIAAALDAHARKHHGEGRTFEEIAVTDFVRRCIASTATAADYVTSHGLETATGTALLAEAEGSCLRSKVADILLMPKKEEVPEDEEMKWREAQIRSMLVFAREHGYQFPPDLMAYEHPPATNALRQKSWQP